MRNHDKLNAMQQHAYMQDMLERISDGFFAVDRNWKVIQWNREAESLLKTERREVLGKKLWDCFPAATRLKYFTLYESAVQKQVPVHFEEYYPPLQLRTDVHAYPSEQGLAVYFRKADERKDTAPDPRLLALIPQETIHAVSLVKEDGSIVWVNEAFTRITGYTLAEAVGKKQSELITGAGTDKATLEEIRQAFFKHLPFHSQYLIYTRHRQKRWVATSGQPLLDPHTNECHYFLVQTDVTAHQNLLRQLKLQQQKNTVAIIEAQERERAIIGQELHDNVNQLLTSVKLYIELCLSGAEQQQRLMQQSSSLLQQVIDDIRSISHRLAIPRQGMSCLSDSLSELASGVAATNKFSIRLQLSAIENLCVHETVHLAAYRILQEHFMNILKHAEASAVEVFAFTDAGELVIKVIDNGRGFNMNEKKSGLGLLSIRNRAESLRGSLVINSKPGLGCVLIVRIPLRP